MLCAAAIMLVGGGVATGQAAERTIDDFYGEYVGRSVAGKDVSARDINVTIAASKYGFNISWSTVTYRTGSEAKRKAYSIDFAKTKRDKIYQSSMRKNVFGKRVPNDPIKGDPYVWARIADDTLSVYALIVTSAGGYDMQVYNRTLTDAGLRLEFTRFLEGETLKTITGELTRVVK
jgi:archaellin